MEVYKKNPTDLTSLSGNGRLAITINEGELSPQWNCLDMSINNNSFKIPSPVLQLLPFFIWQELDPQKFVLL